MKTSSIELAYQQRIDAMTPAERVARSMAMLQWTRQQLARQVIQQHGEISDEKLKWLVALRSYQNEPAIKKMIGEKLADVSDGNLPIHAGEAGSYSSRASYSVSHNRWAHWHCVRRTADDLRH